MVFFKYFKNTCTIVKKIIKTNLNHLFTKSSFYHGQNLYLYNFVFISPVNS